MNAPFFLLALCLSRLLFASPLQDRKLDPTALSQLASALNLPPDANIATAIQKHGLRKPGQERWEMAELSPDQRAFVLSWATEHGFFSPWEPLESSYDTAFLLGASTSRMQMRLDYLAQLWNRGIRFRKIVWLTGDRPLDPRADGLIDRCSTESEAAHILWEEATLPPEMGNLPIVFVAVPMKPEGRRPTTEDTLVAYLNASPSPCKALFVSHQPFCGYQFAVIKGTLPDAFQFDLVGPGADPSRASAAVTLDAIARWTYQEGNSS